MRSPVGWTLLAAAMFAVLTWIIGWTGVVILAILAGARWPAGNGRAGRCAAAAALAWTALLGADVLGGSFARLSGTLGRVMQLPSPVLIVITVSFAAALAWSAASVSAGAMRFISARGLGPARVP